MSQEVTGRLENWYTSKTNIHDIKMTCIKGNLYDDVRVRWLDGVFISTSKLKNKLTECVEGAIIKTENSVYLLGKPKEELKESNWKQEEFKFNDQF